MIKDTSLLAKKKIEKNGVARTQRAAIHNTIYARPHITRQEISALMNIPINAVCGRVNELVKAGKVEEADRRKCRITGNKAWTLMPAKDYAGEVPF